MTQATTERLVKQTIVLKRIKLTLIEIPDSELTTAERKVKELVESVLLGNEKLE